MVSGPSGTNCMHSSSVRAGKVPVRQPAGSWRYLALDWIALSVS